MMVIASEQLVYTANLAEVGETTTNRWSEEFLPDRVEAYWFKDSDNRWALEVATVSGVGVVKVKRTGELGKRRRSEWFDTDTLEQMPELIQALVRTNDPRLATEVSDALLAQG